MACWHRAGQVGALLIHEPDDVCQGGIVAQLAVLVARNVVGRADGGEHFRLFHGVDAEVGFEIEIEIQHVDGIAGLLHYECEDAILHGIGSDSSGRCRNRDRCLSDGMT